MTAGPTREMLDPVRFITNLSTGEMGYAIAREAKEKGFQVTLISGPTALAPPRGIRFVPVVTVSDLERQLRRHFPKTDLLFMSAAVGDFLPVRFASKKVRRQKRWKVEFRQSPDLVKGVAKMRKHQIVIGFSLETSRWIERSRKKRIAKGLDGIVANYYSRRRSPFGKNRVQVALIDGEGSRVLGLQSKSALARRLVRWAVKLGELSKN